MDASIYCHILRRLEAAKDRDIYYLRPHFEFLGSTSSFTTSSSKKGGSPKLKNSNFSQQSGSSAALDASPSTATTANKSPSEKSVCDTLNSWAQRRRSPPAHPRRVAARSSKILISRAKQ